MSYMGYAVLQHIESHCVTRTHIWMLCRWSGRETECD